MGSFCVGGASVERSRRACFCELKKSGFASRVKPPREPNSPPQKRKMILTTCAACAAPLAHTAPRCIRCQTRYCNKTCQHDQALFRDPGATLDDVREAVATLVETARISRLVLGGAHPITMGIEEALRNARAARRARETTPAGDK